jgi:hypothetical protein
LTHRIHTIVFARTATATSRVDKVAYHFRVDAEIVVLVKGPQNWKKEAQVPTKTAAKSAETKR